MLTINRSASPGFSWRVELDGIKAGGVSLAAALMMAFRMAGTVPRGKTRKEAAEHLRAEGCHNWSLPWRRAVAELEMGGINE